jgi:hypothetical protein
MASIRKIKKRVSRLGYWGDCSEVKDYRDDFCKMLEDAVGISRRAFMRKVDAKQMREWARALGYADNSREGITMEEDPGISYWESTFRGCPAAFFFYSGGQYIFVDLDCASKVGL